MTTLRRAIFGELKPVTKTTAEEILKGIEKLQPGGSTNLRNAMTLAEQEIKKHGRETTACIITDGADNTVAGMISEMESDRAAIESRFGMLTGGRPLMHVNTLSPRLLEMTERTGQVSPQNIEEQQLARLSSLFYGVFGFTGIGFSQRGLPAFSKLWNIILWTARMAVVAGGIAYAYPCLRARL